MNDTKDLVALSSTLPDKERQALTAYLNVGGGELSAAAAAQFYELFLRGSSCEEIQRLNKAFPLGAIIQARLKFDWDQRKSDHMMELQNKVADTVMRSQLETAEYLANMLSVAAKRDNDRLKKYLQTGNKEDLGDAMTPSNMMSLTKAIENLMKITGQDKNIKITKKEELNVNLRSEGGLTSDQASSVLTAISAAKRKDAGK